MLIFLGYKFVELIAFTTPYFLTYFIAIIVGKLSFAFGLYLDEIKTNVSNVLNLDKNSRRVLRIVGRIYINWLKNIVDFLKLPIISKEKLKERVEIVGLDNLDKALKKGRGIVIFTAHIGNFEWGACRVAIEGYKIWGTSLERPYNRTNKFFENRRLVKGVKIIYANKILNIFRILRNNEIIAIPTDLDPFGNAKPTEFFGKKAYLPTGAVQIALKTGAQLIPSFVIRKSKYKHYQIIGKPIKLQREGNKEELIKINMAKVIRVIEKYIKENIEEWEMFHNIWAE